MVMTTIVTIVINDNTYVSLTLISTAIYFIIIMVTMLDV